MKKLIVIFISTILIFLSISPFSACAEDVSQAQTEIVDELNDILFDYDIEFSAEDIVTMSFGEILGFLRDRLSERLTAPIQLAVTLFLVIVFGSVMKSFSGSAVTAQSADIYGMVCVLASVTVIIPQLLTIYSEILWLIEVCGGFIMVFVPVLTTVSIGCGKFGTAGVYHVMILAASEFMVRLSEAYLMPILTIMAALAVTGSVFSGTPMDSLSEFIKKAVTWLISIAMTLFTGFMTLKCSIAGKADSATAKTAKMFVSGFVPIVGGAVSDAYSTVKGSFEVIGGTVGAAGIIGIILLVLPLILELFIYRGIMWAGSAVADVFSVDSISRLLRGIDGGLAIAQSVLVSYLVMFVVSSAILMQTLG